MDAGMKASLLHPKFPERICWGCHRYCPAHDLGCRESRVLHPIETDGSDWLELEQARDAERVEIRVSGTRTVQIGELPLDTPLKLESAA